MPSAAEEEEIDEDALAAELAEVEEQAGSITELRHVRSSIVSMIALMEPPMFALMAPRRGTVSAFQTG